MSPAEKDRAIIEATLPGNTSLTHFTDFRSSHEDLARLLSAVRQEAYKEGWNDREGDLIAGVNRIAPEQPPQEGAGEPVAWTYWTNPERGEPADEDGGAVRMVTFDRNWIPQDRNAEPLALQADLDRAVEALRSISDLCPATQETSPAHTMADLANETLATITKGQKT